MLKPLSLDELYIIAEGLVWLQAPNCLNWMDRPAFITTRH